MKDIMHNRKLSMKLFYRLNIDPYLSYKIDLEELITGFIVYIKHPISSCLSTKQCDFLGIIRKFTFHFHEIN